VSQRVLRGLGAAGGVAIGRVHVLRERGARCAAEGADEAARALDALDRTAARLGRLAAAARAAGRTEAADILEANRLMAEDPALRDDVRAGAADASAEAALAATAERYVSLLAALDEPLLAARADDVRQVARLAARELAGEGAPTLAKHSVLVARDVGAADIAELEPQRDRLLGIALAAGAATSHAAIVARSLGVPMVVGLGPELLEAADGEASVLDGDTGLVVLAPEVHVRDRALATVRRREDEQARLRTSRRLRCVTRDGRAVRLLCNAGGLADVAAGLEAGADGVGLLRTELAFLEARSWPTVEEHVAALTPPLERLAARTATVRMLDFGGDKTPPFLAGTTERGLALLLAHPEALRAQLTAIVRAGAGTRLRILLPLAERAEQVEAVRALLGGADVTLGAMVETPSAAARAAELAAAADFLSIGTNDLVQYTLGLDREQPLASARAAADPAVLRLVADVVAAAHAMGRVVEVCGEAAGEPPVAALLVGLGVDELSVSAARLDATRGAVRGLAQRDAAAAARAALAASTAAEALTLGRALVASGETDDELGEPLDGVGGVLA
jgi:phosphoenolpyruvate-protein kinase (PTS system EI component)